MRSTVRIDDDLMQALKSRAEREGASLTRTLNSVLRSGLSAANSAGPRAPFRQRTAKLGRASFDIDRALALATALEDEAILAKLAARK